MVKLGGWTKPTLICIVPVALVVAREDMRLTENGCVETKMKDLVFRLLR